MSGISDGLRISEQIDVIQREDLLKFRGAESMQTNLSQEVILKLAVLALHCFTQRISKHS